MLSDKAVETLAGLAQIELADLKTAIASDEAQEITTPEGVVSYTPDGLNEFKDNAITQAKEGIKTAAREEFIRTQATELELELSDKDKRDPSKVFGAFKDKVLADAKLPLDDKVKDFEAKLEAKDALIETARGETTKAKADYEDFKFGTGVNNSIMGSFGESTTHTKEERLAIFRANFTIKKEEDKTVVLDNATGKIIQDDKLNSKSIGDVVAGFDKKYTVTKGRGGPGGPPERQLPITDVHKQLETENLKKGSIEYYKRMNELLNKK